MSNMYIVVERFIIMGRHLQIIIRIQGIEPCFMMNKNRKDDYPKILLTQESDRKGSTLIEIPFNKENMYIPSTQVSEVIDVT